MKALSPITLGILPDPIAIAEFRRSLLRPSRIDAAAIMRFWQGRGRCPCGSRPRTAKLGL
jgi:hypothetical protein